MGIAKKPDVDQIQGLCPAIAIEQKTVGANPRSTVGTITEIYDYLRVLFARIGIAHCPTCNAAIQAESAEGIVAMVSQQFAGHTITVAAPIANERKGEFVNDLKRLFNAGWYRFAIDGTTYRFQSAEEINDLKLRKTFKHTVDCLIDVFAVTKSEIARLNEAVETAFKLTNGMCKIIVGETEYLYSSSRMCLSCARSIPELEPRLFSFNSPIGACTRCNGLGIIHEWPWDTSDPEAWKANYPEFFGKYANEQTCGACAGHRLNPIALAVTVGDKNIYEICQLSIKECFEIF